MAQTIPGSKPRPKSQYESVRGTRPASREPSGVCAHHGAPSGATSLSRGIPYFARPDHVEPIDHLDFTWSVCVPSRRVERKREREAEMI